MTDPPATPKRGWRDAVTAYGDRRVLAMLFLGFAAGLPLLLVFGTLSVWLRESKISLATIGFASWIAFAYSLKFIWSPLVDRMPLPFLTRALGRRRGWMLLAQAGIVLGLVGMAFGDPLADLRWLVACALVVAFSSATQDIAIDAFRIESAPEDLQGATAGAYQLGYRIALLAAGTGALYIAEGYGWRIAYFAMAALMVVGMVTVLVVREPQAVARPLAVLTGPAPRRMAIWFVDAVVNPFVDFFRRNGWIALVILLFIGAFRLADITLGVMANPFYIDIGFTKTEIASISKIYGIWMSIAGALLGGVLVARYGVLRPLLFCAILTAITNLLFAALALHGKDILFLVFTISADNLAGGMAGTALIAYLSSLTNTAYTATQYALFSSFMSLPGKFIGGFSGVVAEGIGYAWFFVYTTAMGIPALILLLVLMTKARHLSRPPAAKAEAPAPA